MGANIHDGFANADRARTLEPLRQFLDTAAQLPEIEDYKRRLRTHLALQAGESFLDVGCGMGHEVCRVALDVPGARVIGLDRAAVVHEAASRASELDVDIEWLAADAEAIPLPDATVDACMTERVLKYLPEPELALREIARVLKPGGRFGSFELDYDATVLCGQATNAALVVDALRGSVAQPRMGRRLPEILAGLGMRDLTCRPVAFIPPWEIQEKVVCDTVREAAAAGRLPADQASEWLAQHASAHRCGYFTVAFVGCLVTARMPA